MESNPCAACGQPFRAPPQAPAQRFCSSAACQRERRRQWQRTRRREDPEYRDNQAQAQRAWVERNPDYWRKYRQHNPMYERENRAKQQVRDAKRRERVLAKMDASTPDSPVPSGTYWLRPVGSEDLAKMDAWTVEIRLVST
jgi:hypothetical protein